MENEIFDRRVVEKNLREGLISPADYEKFLKSIPDTKDKLQWTPIDEIAPRRYLKSVLGIEPKSDDE